MPKMKQIDEMPDLIDRLLPFASNLSGEEKEELLQNCQIREFKKGDAIHGGSSDCVGVLGVVEGQLRTFLFSSEGKEITLFRLLSGDSCILSASCMLKNIAFDVHVETEADSRLIIINPAHFERLAAENSAVERFKNQIISMRFSEVMWLMEQVLFMKMDQRVATLLLEKVNLTGSRKLSITHQEMADDLGTAREVVSRILKYFENEGIISLSRKQLSIIDWNRLAAVAG